MNVLKLPASENINLLFCTSTAFTGPLSITLHGYDFNLLFESKLKLT
jgi:hypothetical protein